MKILISKKTMRYTLFICFFNAFIFAQESTVTVEQDPKFEQLLNEKVKLSNSIFINDRYKIQIYNGDSETAKKSLSDFKKQYNTFDATIIFSTPSYKVWVGNFKTRIDAEKQLMDISKNYPKAFLIKPNK